MAEVTLASRIQLEIRQFRAAIRLAQREVARFNREAEQGARGSATAFDATTRATSTLGAGYRGAERDAGAFNREAERGARNVSDVLNAATADVRNLGEEFDRAEREVNQFTSDAERGTRSVSQVLEEATRDVRNLGDGFDRAEREAREFTRDARSGSRDLSRVLEAIEANTRAITAGFGRAERALSEFNREGVRGTRRINRETESLLASIRRTGQSFISLRTLGIGAFGAIAVSATRTAISTSESFRGLEIGFSTLLGGARAASEEFGFARQEAGRLGVRFKDLLEGSRGLTAALRGTQLEGQATRDIFIAVSETARVLNLSADNTRGALLAVEQIASKGVVSMEELRRQLGDRIPGAFRLAAEAMGVSTAELNNLVASGQLASTEFLPRFAEVLRRTFGGGIEQASQTFSAATARFLTGFDDLLRAFGDIITTSEPVIGALNNIGDTLSNIAEVARPFTPFEEVENELARAQARLQAAESGIANIASRIGRALGLQNIDSRDIQVLREQLDAATRAFDDLVESANMLEEEANSLGQAIGRNIIAEAEEARKATERFNDALSNLAGIESLDTLGIQLAALNALLDRTGIPGEIDAINDAIRDTQEAIRELRVGPLVASLSDVAETAEDAFSELQASIDPIPDLIEDIAATAIRELSRTEPTLIEQQRLWSDLENIIDGVATTAEERIDDIAMETIRGLELTERQAQETEDRLRALTGIRPFEEIADDIRFLEDALEDAQTPREIRAIEDALRELRSEATETSREMQIAFEEANNAIDRSIRDFVNGELDLLETLEDAFSETLTRMAQEAARAQLEPLLRSSLGSLFGGGRGQGAGAAQAGTVPVSPGGFLQGGTAAQGGGGQGAAAGAGGASAGGAFGLVGLQILQGINTTSEVISGLRSDNRRERVEARGRTALVAGGVLLGGVGGLLLDQIDQQFAGGAIARSVGGLLSGDAPSLSVTIATAVSDELALASGEIENLTGSLSTPFGRLLVTDIDDISKKAAREVARFVQSIDQDAAAFLNEAQIGAVSRALNLTTFDQSFGQRIDEDNLADILVERFGSIFEAAAAATPDLLAVSPGQFRGNIFAGIDEDDLDAVQQRVTEVGQLLQTITRFSTDRDITQVELALRAIEDTFRPLRQAADDFGLSLQNLAVLQQQATQDLRDAFTENIGDALLAIQDPLALANLQLDRRREVLIREANALGLSTDNIEQLIAAERRLLDIRQEQQVLAEVIQVGNLADQIEALRTAGEAVSPFITELRGLGAAAQQLRAEALQIEAALGPGAVQIPDIGRALTQGTQSLARRFREEIEAEALAITDPFGFELLELERAFELALEAARALQAESGLQGLTLVVEDLFDLQREALFAQRDAARAQERAAELSQVQTQLDPINDFLQRLEIGAGTFTPAQVLTNTQAAFERALQGTDVFDVVTLGQQLIDASREVNTSAPAFFDTLSNVQSQVLDFADAIAANATSLTDVNQSVQLQTQAVVNLLEDLLARAVENNVDNTNIRNLLELTLAGTA